jgi:hypothetical protein
MVGLEKEKTLVELCRVGCALGCQDGDIPRHHPGQFGCNIGPELTSIHVCPIPGYSSSKYMIFIQFLSHINVAKTYNT